MKGKRHLDFYKNNRKYADLLSSVENSLYNKYLAMMKPKNKGIKVLDVGCGVGTVVNQMIKRGWGEIYGIDVSETFLKIARRGQGSFKLFDGSKIPFKDSFFDVVGSFAVLEHVDNPLEILGEMVRVTKRNGIIIVASPNFLRVIGFSSFHPRTDGLIRSLTNLSLLIKKYYCSILIKNSMHFEFMEPILDVPFKADYDAICLTNPVDVKYFLRKRNVRIIYQSGLVSYHKSFLINFLSTLPVLRELSGGFFLVGVRN